MRLRQTRLLIKFTISFAVTALGGCGAPSSVPDAPAPLTTPSGSNATGNACPATGAAAGTATPATTPSSGSAASLNLDTSARVGYSDTLQALITKNCASCHSPGQTPPDLSTYANAAASAQASLGMIQTGSMPPNATLSAADKASFAAWVQDGALESANSAGSTATAPATGTASAAAAASASAVCPSAPTAPAPAPAPAPVPVPVPPASTLDATPLGTVSPATPEPAPTPLPTPITTPTPTTAPTKPNKGGLIIGIIGAIINGLKNNQGANSTTATAAPQP